MFAMRAQKLYNLYQAYAHIDEIPQAERIKIEKQVFQKTLAGSLGRNRIVFSG